MLERLAPVPCSQGEQAGDRNHELSLGSSPALPYASGELLWNAPVLEASQPPSPSPRVWSAFAAGYLGNYTESPEIKCLTLCSVGECPAGAATGQGARVGHPPPLPTLPQPAQTKSLDSA